MDCKKFIQLVEKKKKRALQKREAPLKWGEEIGSRCEGKEKKHKAAKHERRSLLKSDSGSGSESGEEAKRRTHKWKQMKNAGSDSSENERGRDRTSKREPVSRSAGSSDDSRFKARLH